MRSKVEIAFQKKVNELIRRAGKLEDAEVRKVIKFLADARKEVAATVASMDWQSYYLPQMKNAIEAIERAMQDFGSKYGVDLRNAQRSFWEQGTDMVDLPLNAAGITAFIPEIDMTALSIMQGFSSDLVAGLSRSAMTQINREMTIGLMGMKTPYEVMRAVGRNLKDSSIFKSIAARAETITRTECGRVLEMASQARMTEAAKSVPGLQKQWRHGTVTRMPRAMHLAADGQIRDVDKPFNVGGEELMYPRDPAGSASNTINCGCYSVPYHPDWGKAGA